MSALDLIAGGALVVVNHSGGKDSQALLIKLLGLVPRNQILVVHASLGEFEWHGALELAQKQAAEAGVPFVVARAAKSFLDMVERKFDRVPEVPSFPSAKHRQCTSDLKRDPIDREVRAYAKQAGFSTIISATGIRAQESASRAKAEVFKRNTRNSVAGRDWYDWAPIHALSTVEVFATIAAAGQEPHPAYAAGNERLSCVFCIMGSKTDILNGALARPELFARIAEVEARTGYTLHMSRKSLTQLVVEAQDLAKAA
jgi:3'-phosphoadenosine 5'-phosphosulfate sulfotransferase (PAPS reductase)/FAD synthetase